MVEAKKSIVAEAVVVCEFKIVPEVEPIFRHQVGKRFPEKNELLPHGLVEVAKIVAARLEVIGDERGVARNGAEPV